jgi:broad specificity phosphatase PhoE
MTKPHVDPCFMYLVRHGATANNIAKPPRLQGCRTDPPLSDTGRRQARATADLLARYEISAVYASPLLRSRETAEIIAAPHKIDVRQFDEILEVDVGEWEERTWDDIERSNPEAYRLFMEDPGRNSYFGGESFGQVQDRVVPAFERLMAGHGGQQIVVAGHNVVNRTYLAWLLGIPVARARRVSQHNCGVNVVRYRKGKMELRVCNSGFHLEEI